MRKRVSTILAERSYINMSIIHSKGLHTLEQLLVCLRLYIVSGYGFVGIVEKSHFRSVCGGASTDILPY